MLITYLRFSRSIPASPLAGRPPRSIRGRGQYSRDETWRDAGEPLCISAVFPVVDGGGVTGRHEPGFQSSGGALRKPEYVSHRDNAEMNRARGSSAHNV